MTHTCKSLSKDTFVTFWDSFTHRFGRFPVDIVPIQIYLLTYRQTHKPTAMKTFWVPLMRQNAFAAGSPAARTFVVLFAKVGLSKNDHVK